MESIEKNIDKYIDYLKYEKKLSNNTISSYYENLKKFYSHFEKKNILNLNADEIRDFLYDEGIVARTRAHYLTVLNSFYNYLDDKLDTMARNTSIDYDRMGEAMVDALNGIGMYMDSKKVGRLTSKPVQEDISNRTKRLNRLGGI